jgi:hypothetical protein
MDADARRVTTPPSGNRLAIPLQWPDVDAGRVLLLVLAAWAIAMIAPDAYRVFGSLGSFGLVADNDGVIVDAVGPFATPRQSPAAVAGIVPGDRIDLRAMRCVPLASPRCRSLLSVLGGLGGTQVVRPGRTIELVIEPADGSATKVVRMQAASTTQGWGDRLVLLADTIVGIIVILAACRLVWIHPGRMTWGFFLYAMWFNPGQTFAYYTLLQQWPAAIFAQEVGEALAHGAGYAGLLIFALRFPFDSPSAPRDRYEWLALGVGATITALWFASFSNAFGAHTETLTSTAFLLGYVVDAVVVFILVVRRRALPALDRQRMLWVICGCAIGLPAFIFAEIAQSTSLLLHALRVSPSTVLIGLLYLLNGVLVYFVSVAVLHRRVISVSIPLRHGTVLSALSLAVGIPIVNLHELLSHYQDSFLIPEWAWLLVVAPIALVLLQRLHEIGVKVVDRFLNHRFHTARAQLQDAGAAMLKARTFDEIDRLLVATAMYALKLSSGAVFRRQDGAFRHQYAIGWDGSGLRELTPDHDGAVLRSIETSAIVRLPRDEWGRAGLEAKLQAPCIAVPVCSDALGGVGIVLFGPHLNGNDIDLDECEMLGAFAHRAARGYERAAFVVLREEVADLRTRLHALQGTAA